MADLSRRDRNLLAHITNVRSSNNVNWMTLLQIALRADPQATRAVLRQINEADNEVSRLLRQLADE